MDYMGKNEQIVLVFHLNAFFMTRLQDLFNGEISRNCDLECKILIFKIGDGPYVDPWIHMVKRIYELGNRFGYVKDDEDGG